MKLQNQYTQFQKLGVEVVTVFGQKQATVAQFADEHSLPFLCLIDEERKVIKAFDVYHAFGIDAFNIARPSLFVISADGIIKFSYVGSNQFDRPADSIVLDEVQQLIGTTFNDE